MKNKFISIFLSLLFLQLLSLRSVGQQHARRSKPVIDTSVLNNWPQLNSPIINSNGRYVAYRMYQPRGPLTTIICDTSGIVHWVDPIAGKMMFIDSDHAVISRPDSLLFLNLNQMTVDSSIAIRSVDIAENHDRWVLYAPQNTSYSLIVPKLSY
jgi:hypothetical protein